LVVRTEDPGSANLLLPDEPLAVIGQCQPMHSYKAMPANAQL